MTVVDNRHCFERDIVFTLEVFPSDSFFKIFVCVGKWNFKDVMSGKIGFAEYFDAKLACSKVR